MKMEVVTHRQREVLLQLARSATERFRVVSPWVIGEDQLRKVLEAVPKDVDAEVTMRWPVNNGDARLFDRKAMDLLEVRCGDDVYMVPPEKPLHAKVYIADDRVALVTSANLTGHGFPEGGTGNQEVGILTHDPGAIAELVRWLEADLERFSVKEKLTATEWKAAKDEWEVAKAEWPKPAALATSDYLTNELARTRLLIAERLTEAAKLPRPIIVSGADAGKAARSRVSFRLLYNLTLRGRATPYPVRVLTRQRGGDEGSPRWRFGVGRPDLLLWRESRGKRSDLKLLGLLCLPRNLPEEPERRMVGVLVELDRLFHRNRVPQNVFAKADAPVRDLYLEPLGARSWQMRFAGESEAMRLTSGDGGVWRLPPIP